MSHLFLLSNIPPSNTNIIPAYSSSSYTPKAHSGVSSYSSSFRMNTQLERPRITEINVRMDCNGCVQKIKKALHGINGIYDLYIDFPQQKLTVVGWADPDRIMKAIKKVRKVATICSHTEAPDPNSQPTETPQDGAAPPPEGEAQAPDTGNPPPGEPHQSEAAPPQEPSPQEPPNDQPPPQQPPENPPEQNPPPETNPPPQDANCQPSQPENPARPGDVEEVRTIYHNPHEPGHRYGYSNGYGPGYSHSNGGQWSSHTGPGYRHEPPPQPVYHEPPPPVYQERPRSTYHEQPHPIYHESRSVYHEPPSRLVYHESPSRTVYHEPPSRPVYHEPPSRPVYHEPPHSSFYHEPPPQPAYHESPPQHAYHEPPPQPSYVTHSYNTYRPSPYVTEYEYVRSPPRYTSYDRTDHYNMDPYRHGGASNGNVTSMFSDENPNACTIV